MGGGSEGKEVQGSRNMRGGPRAGSHGRRFFRRESLEEKEDQGAGCAGTEESQAGRLSGKMSRWSLAQGEDGCPGWEVQERRNRRRLREGVQGRRFSRTAGRRWPRGQGMAKGGGPGEVAEAAAAGEAQGRPRLAAVALPRDGRTQPCPARSPACSPPPPAQLGQVSAGWGWGGGPRHGDLPGGGAGGTRRQSSWVQQA